MARLNLKEVLVQYGLSEKEAASVLFPDNKFALVALRRILDGKAILDSAQVATLAEHIGVCISDLYSCGNWYARASKDYIEFRRGDVTASLAYGGTLLTLRHGGNTVQELVVPTSITLSELIGKLNTAYIQFKGESNLTL